jgi:large subunit ribosomal protein L3
MGFAGWKAGMTHILVIDSNAKSQTYGKSIVKPATILDAPSLFVCGYRLYQSSIPSTTIGEKWTTKLPKGLELMRKAAPSRKELDAALIEKANDVYLIVTTQPARAGIRKKKPEVFELALGGEYKQKLEYAESMLGKELNAKDIFKPGDFIDASGVTKGHGFTGPVKRYHIRIQTRKDKQMHRHVGSIGSTVPRKVDWRVPQAGQYGYHARTEFNKRILMIEDDPKKITPTGGFVSYGLIPGSFILVEGSVPGVRKRLIRIRKAVRTSKHIPPEIKYVSLSSKQGSRSKV